MQIKKVSSRHGTFLFPATDTFVGRSLELYGEYSEAEVAVYDICLKEGDTAILVGANIGSLAVPMAHRVGITGRVYAYEPHPVLCQLLRENLTNNSVDNVIVKQCAAGNFDGYSTVPRLETITNDNFGQVELGKGDLSVQVRPLNDLKLSNLNFIQIDAEGSELQVLEGATEIIDRFRPMIYVENDRHEKSAELIGWLLDHGYRCYWHRPPLFNPNNFNGAKHNVFSSIVSINMLCVPAEKRDAGGYFEVRGLDEVADARTDDKMYAREKARYELEVERHPDDMTARLLVAHYSNMLGQPDRARQLIEDNLKIDPRHAPTLAIQGMLDLQQGKYEAGWKNYEMRYAIKEKSHFGGNRTFTVPKWNGERTSEPVLIWSEQGFGDSIMFARFLGRASELIPNMIVDVQPQLFELFELSHLGYPNLYRRGRSLPEFAMHCSMPSLPATLGLTQAAELEHPYYLRPDPEMVESWDKKLDPDRLRVGVCWKGSPRSERPYSRDIDIDLLAPVLRPYEPWVSLMQDGQFESFSDTAAAIAALDVVVTVDTSIAHLAGALGVETWLLLSTDPDFRWGLNSTTTPWYGSMTIFRQERLMDWSNVIHDLEEALEARSTRQIPRRVAI